MVTSEQVTLMTVYTGADRNSVRSGLEAYEQSKWVEFDPDDNSTWPTEIKEYLVFLSYSNSAEVFNFTVVDNTPSFSREDGGYLDAYTNSVTEEVTHWQPLPELKET